MRQRNVVPRGDVINQSIKADLLQQTILLDHYASLKTDKVDGATDESVSKQADKEMRGTEFLRDLSVMVTDTASMVVEEQAVVVADEQRERKNESNRLEPCTEVCQNGNNLQEARATSPGRIFSGSRESSLSSLPDSCSSSWLGESSHR